MTNNYFTEPAINTAKELGVILWDRNFLDKMIKAAYSSSKEQKLNIIVSSLKVEATKTKKTKSSKSNSGCGCGTFFVLLAIAWVLLSIFDSNDSQNKQVVSSNSNSDTSIVISRTSTSTYTKLDFSNGDYIDLTECSVCGKIKIMCRCSFRHLEKGFAYLIYTETIPNSVDDNNLYEIVDESTNTYVFTETTGYLSLDNNDRFYTSSEQLSELRNKYKEELSTIAQQLDYYENEHCITIGDT